MNKILIIDDQAQNCHDIASMLAGLDVALLYCHRGQDALAHIREHIPSLVLLDAEMPKINGYQIINQMWADDDLRQLPVLLMTTHFADRKQLLHQPLLEVIDSLPKPINPLLLVGRVKMALTLRAHQQFIKSILIDGGQAMRKRHEGVLGVDLDGKITFANATALALLRTNHQMIFGVYLESIFEEPNHLVASNWQAHPIQRVCSQGNVLQIQACVLHCADGNTINVKMAAIPMASGSDLALTIAFRQISAQQVEQDINESEAPHLQHFDTLTGVYNRQAFEQLIDDRIKRHAGTGQKIAVIQLDLTHFSHVNETLGHKVGDRMLKDVVVRIQKSVRPTDRIGRIGGDVFALMVDDVPNPKSAGVIAQKLIDALTESFLLEGFELYIGASIGIASFPECGKTSGQLLKNAALAVEAAKLMGTNSYQYFTAKMNDEMLARVKLESSLHHAMERGEIEATMGKVVCTTPSTRFFQTPNLFILAIKWVHKRYGCNTHALLQLLERHGALDLYREMLQGVLEQFVTEAPDRSILLVPMSVRFLMSQNLSQDIDELLAKGRANMIRWVIQEESLGRYLARTGTNTEVYSLFKRGGLGMYANRGGCLAQSLLDLDLEFLYFEKESGDPKEAMLRQASMNVAKALDIAVICEY